MMGLYFEDFETGVRYPTYGRTITEGDLSTFCCFAGYHNPLFIDEEAAKQTSYGGRIVPSSLTMSVSTAMTESLFRETVIALKSVDNGRFLLPVRPGDTIRTEVEGRWCMDIPAERSVPRRSAYLIRTDAGMPRLVMRFRTLQPIFASVR